MYAFIESASLLVYNKYQCFDTSGLLVHCIRKAVVFLFLFVWIWSGRETQYFCIGLMNIFFSFLTGFIYIWTSYILKKSFFLYVALTMWKLCKKSMFGKAWPCVSPFHLNCAICWVFATYLHVWLSKQKKPCAIKNNLTKNKIRYVLMFG